MGLTTLGTKLYAVGGNNGSADLARVEVLDPAVGKWVPGPPLSTARYGLGLGTLGSMLYAVGGNDGAADLAIIEVLDPAVGKWVPGPPLRGKSALWLACSQKISFIEESLLC